MSTANLKRKKGTRRDSHVLPSASSKLQTLHEPFNVGPPQTYHGEPTGKNPLIPPYSIIAEYTNEETMIKINVTVGINSDLSISELDIYGGDAMVKPSPNKNMQKLYIVYDKQEGAMEKFTPYYLEFEIPAYIGETLINTLEIYLWNEDPKTSRGTVTTVKHSKLAVEDC